MTAIDRKVFFDAVNEPEPMGWAAELLFNMIFDKWFVRDPDDMRWLAYVLATAIYEPNRLHPDGWAATWAQLDAGIVPMLTAMIDGTYTGRSMREFFRPRASYWVAARAVTDSSMTMAVEIADFAKLVGASLNEASFMSLPMVGFSDVAVPPATE